MFSAQVAPMLEKLLPAGDGPRAFCRIYRLIGIGESQVEALVGAELGKMEGLEIGYCARLGEVDLRCIGTPDLLERAEAVIIPALQQSLLSRDGKTLEEVLVRRLRERGQTARRGGELHGRPAGAPADQRARGERRVRRGADTYAYSAKTALLKVGEELIKQHGAVSAPVAAAMAAGARAGDGRELRAGDDGRGRPGKRRGQAGGHAFHRAGG